MRRSSSTPTCSSMKQGPWTDIYALGAVVYFAITGKTPDASVARLISDPTVPLATSAAGRYSAQFLRGVDKALEREAPGPAAEHGRAAHLARTRRRTRHGARSDGAPGLAGEPHHGGCARARRARSGRAGNDARERSGTHAGSRPSARRDQPAQAPDGTDRCAAGRVRRLWSCRRFFSCCRRPIRKWRNPARQWWRRPTSPTPGVTTPAVITRPAPAPATTELPASRPAPVLPAEAAPTRPPAGAPAPSVVESSPAGKNTKRSAASGTKSECVDILQRASLGEPLSQADQATLKEHCR